LAKSEFDAFCRKAFDFLAAARVRYLVVGGLAVVAVGEPRITGDVDVIGFLALAEAEDLILFKVLAGRDKDLVDATGVARRHASKLDLAYLRATLQPICDLAQDMSAWLRLEEVVKKAASP
jgi:hypothetical protein